MQELQKHHIQQYESQQAEKPSD